MPSWQSPAAVRIIGENFFAANEKTKGTMVVKIDRRCTSVIVIPTPVKQARAVISARAGRRDLAFGWYGASSLRSPDRSRAGFASPTPAGRLIIPLRFRGAYYAEESVAGNKRKRPFRSDEGLRAAQ